ncbi:MAG: acyl-CoA dehydrogenase family protein [Candidatus Sericytochromatia bacterium]|nr:acyl-CoA dehydrogenase family protein [Candidatus Sericytochromatia bacterium]
MAERHARARAEMQKWLACQPANFYTHNRQLQRLLQRLMPTEHFHAHQPHFEFFGGIAANVLDQAAIVNNRDGNLPRLDRFSPVGERREALENHPSYDACGRAIYQDGRLISTYGERPANLRAQALFYLSSHAGEAGHNCPVACTAGVVKALQGAASEALRARFLPAVLRDVWGERLDGAQFLTELQGGSDVGANAVEAHPDGEEWGTTRWRIFGEKWFCSNAGADLILMTARYAGGPSGTAGLGLFLVPRYLEDGRVNYFFLRRLKEKLGTRSMPSAEIDFEGAVAYAIGQVHDGFKHVMNYVINTSRLYNSTGCAGIARRAHLVASGYARARMAFGRPISDYPLVQEMLAHTYVTSAVMLAASLDTAAALDRVEAGLVDEPERAFVRVSINLLKMITCQHSHRVVLAAIETLGGNGAIESFSVLPRLLRDNVVYENWEGTHNTLVAQTLRDFQRPALREGFLSGLRARLLPLDDLCQSLLPAFAALERFEREWPAIAQEADAGVGALMLRPHAEALAHALLAVAYAQDVACEADGERRAVEEEALRLFLDKHLGVGRVVRDAAYAGRVQRIAGLEP